MKMPRDLSGADLIKLLCRHWGYRRVNQEDSHVILETDSRDTIGLLFLTTIHCGSAR